MLKISVIIPVYNAEKYIIKCLNSIVNQTMKDVEVIIINDGSVDNSEEVILEYIRRHNNSNIKYLKKENGGLSDARNFGVLHARGKYISFIDADDYIERDLYERLDKYIKQDIDVIKYKMITVNESGNIIKKLDGPVFEKCSGELAFEKLCTRDKYIDPACIYLYKRSFFIDNSFKYEVGTFHEDFGLTSFVIIKAKSFVSTDIYGYYYLQSNDSITRNVNEEKNIKKAYDLLKHYDNMKINIEKDFFSKKTKELVKRYYTNSVLLKTLELRDNKKEYKKYIKEIKKRKMYRNIKPYNTKQLIKRILLKISIKLYLVIRL